MATKSALNKARSLVAEIARKGCEIDALIEQLRKLALSYDEYKAIRASFFAAYFEAKGADPKDKATSAAARKAWSRVLKAIGVEKPLSNSADATRKRQARQAAKADKAADEGAPIPPAGAAKVGEKVRMELVPDEVHIIKLIRQHKLAAAIDFIHKLAESAAA